MEQKKAKPTLTDDQQKVDGIAPDAEGANGSEENERPKVVDRISGAFSFRVASSLNRLISAKSLRLPTS